MEREQGDEIKVVKDIGKEEERNEKIPVCLTIYEELNTSESESESDESSDGDPRDGVDRIVVECGEHVRLTRLGQKTGRRISGRSGERKVSVRNVKVSKPYYHFEKIFNIYAYLGYFCEYKKLNNSRIKMIKIFLLCFVFKQIIFLVNSNVIPLLYES
jgi:hypothetical protein